MKYLVIDVEATGLEPGYHEIIQLGACILMRTGVRWEHF